MAERAVIAYRCLWNDARIGELRAKMRRECERSDGGVNERVEGEMAIPVWHGGREWECKMECEQSTK